MSSQQTDSDEEGVESGTIRELARKRFQRLAENLKLEDLTEIALAMSQQNRPGLDLAESREALADLVSGFQQMIAAQKPSSAKDYARNLCHFLYEQQGFAGNQEAYYDPDNSYLDRLLHLRRGIPISLALLYIHIGRKVGLDVQGIGFPGHFLIGVYQDDERALLDPFAGRLITQVGLLELLKQQRGAAAVLDETLLQPASASDIVIRMVNNLRAIYQQQGDHQRQLSCCDQILMIDPENPQELFQRIAIYLQLEQKQLALMELGRLRGKVDDDNFKQRIESMMLEIDIDPGPLQ